jgi:hypothetical protein
MASRLSINCALYFVFSLRWFLRVFIFAVVCFFSNFSVGGGYNNVYHFEQILEIKNVTYEIYIYCFVVYRNKAIKN